jgi:anaerobic ribonucleoside-triphosphate reductase activating protein
MTEIVLAIVGSDGEFLVDDTNKEFSADIQAAINPMLGEPTGIACAAPPQLLQLPEVHRCSNCGKRYGSACAEGACSRFTPAYETFIQIGGYYHDSLIDGPGRRSVVRVQGCPIKCAGCYVPQTHDASAGTLVSVETLTVALLNPAHERDGVTIIGGEPFAQPTALAALVRKLHERQPDLNICIYTGYTLEALRMRNDLYIDFVLDEIDTLIDGPFVQALSAGAGPYTGSSNQRVLDMTEHRSPDRF